MTGTFQSQSFLALPSSVSSLSSTHAICSTIFVAHRALAATLTGIDLRRGNSAQWVSTWLVTDAKALAAIFVLVRTHHLIVSALKTHLCTRILIHSDPRRVPTGSVRKLWLAGVCLQHPQDSFPTGLRPHDSRSSHCSAAGLCRTEFICLIQFLIDAGSNPADINFFLLF